jgi:hypothetical protein
MPVGGESRARKQAESADEALETASPESSQVRAERLEVESRELAAARDDVRAGRFIADDAVDEWLDSLVQGTGPMPIPQGPTGPPRRQ